MTTDQWNATQNNSFVDAQTGYRPRFSQEFGSGRFYRCSEKDPCF